MKLYITPLSPYARITRSVALEKGLGDRVEILEARTRVADSPYYAINPSGRVPCLIRDDGVGIEGSSLICAYLDALDGAPAFAMPPDERGWEIQRLEAVARSLMDGLTVWEREVDHPLMRGELDLAQTTLACALGYRSRVLGSDWRSEQPGLASWLDSFAERASFAATEAPADG